MARTFSLFLKRVHSPLNAGQIAFLCLLAAGVMGTYLAYGFSTSGAGYPLDDSWIHQTYARNLIMRGEWAFNPGEPSAGATSPLWVVLLVVGAWLNNPYIWTFFLGWVLLAAIGFLGAIAFSNLSPRATDWVVWVGALIIADFHMVWAAVSGMETLLFTALVSLALVLVLSSAAKKKPRHFWTLAGTVAGAAVWVRPEGVTLIAPLVGAVLLFEDRKQRVGALFKLLVSLVLIFAFYLAFNLSVSGNVWPNTLLAKQAEYSSLLAAPFYERFAQQLFQPLIGAGLLLLPGFAFLLFQSLTRKSWSLLLWAIWLFGFLALFALRLPVVYQHGRYAMPVVPVYFLIGFSGTIDLIQRLRGILGQRLKIAWLGGLSMLSLGMAVLGATAYGRDLDFINSQMVVTAIWVKANTPADSPVAAHDIGALGYFSDRHIIDMAGLVSPEVISFIRDESRLTSYLDEEGADYLVAFPSWYPQLTEGAVVFFQPQNPDFEPLTVYAWPK